MNSKTTYPNDLTAWEALLASGSVTHVTPRRVCGELQLIAYDRRRNIPYLNAIAESEEAYRLVRAARVGIEEPK